MAGVSVAALLINLSLIKHVDSGWCEPGTTHQATGKQRHMTDVGGSVRRLADEQSRPSEARSSQLHPC